MVNITRHRSIILVAAAMLMLAVTWPEVALSGDPSLTTEPLADLSETKTLINAIFKVVSSLIVVVALMLGVVYLIKKSGINKGLKSGSMVKVLETKMVAPKKYIAIVEVAGKTLSIGVTDHNINLLTELDSATVKQFQAASGETHSPRVTNKFAALLAKATSKKEV
jgi:flagellar biosynthetic protein FliO